MVVSELARGQSVSSPDYYLPVLMVSEFREEEYMDGSNVTTCLMDASEFWPSFYFTASITVFFCLPLAVLVGLYSVIARHLMSNPGLVAPTSHSSALKYRRQVVLMLGTVVLSFFICLLPFKAFTLYVIFASPEFIVSMGLETFYNLLYVCRIMLYLNSAVNPILYNLMSSKFRDGFRKLLGIRAGDKNLTRKAVNMRRDPKSINFIQDSEYISECYRGLIGQGPGTITTTTLTSSTRTHSSSEAALLRKSVVRVISLEDSGKLDNGITTTIKLLNSAIIKSDESYV